MTDQYTVRVVRHSGINGSLCLAATLDDPMEVGRLVTDLIMGRMVPQAEPGDVITINLLGDFEEWKREREQG